VTQGGPVSHFFIIKEGEVLVTRHDPARAEALRTSVQYVPGQTGDADADSAMEFVDS